MIVDDRRAGPGPDVLEQEHTADPVASLEREDPPLPDPHDVGPVARVEPGRLLLVDLPLDHDLVVGIGRVLVRERSHAPTWAVGNRAGGTHSVELCGGLGLGSGTKGAGPGIRGAAGQLGSTLALWCQQHGPAGGRLEQRARLGRVRVWASSIVSGHRGDEAWSGAWRAARMASTTGSGRTRSSHSSSARTPCHNNMGRPSWTVSPAAPARSSRPSRGRG